MGNLCKLQYSAFETPGGPVRIVSRCIPNTGVFLFEVNASYASAKSAVYHVLGRSRKDALSRFLSAFTWMKINSVRLIPPGPESERILTDPMRMPIY